VLALTPTVFRHRREANRQKHLIANLKTVSAPSAAQPQPDGIATLQ